MILKNGFIVKQMCKLFLIASLVLCFCSNNSGAQSAGVKKITINEGKTYKIKKNSKKYTFTSNKPKIAGVTKKGVIKAKKCGTCIIKVKKNGKTFRKYRIKVVNAPVEPTPQPTPEPQPTPTPQPMPTPAPGAHYYISGTASSIKQLDDGNYEYVIDFDESDIQRIKDYFRDCPSIKRIICKSSRHYDVNRVVSIMLHKESYAYTVRDDTTVELISNYNLI